MKAPPPDDCHEREAMALGHRRIAGVDEAGRGPLAGPVVAAAVVLDLDNVPEGLADSKKLSRSQRTSVEAGIRALAEFGVGIASVREIDEMNILQASHLAMARAIDDLERRPDYVLIDGNLMPGQTEVPGRALVRGDAISLSVAAASIIAKCTRDRIMVDLAQQHPGYGWETNAAYPTKAHIQALRDLGVTPHHRRTFAPVHNILCRENSVSN